MKLLPTSITLALVLALPYVAHAEDGALALEKFHETNRQAYLLQKQQKAEREQLAKTRDGATKNAKANTASDAKSDS